jgi:hypothetical protein
VTGQWFSPGTLVSSTNKIDRHDITVISVDGTFSVGRIYNISLKD